MSRSVLSSPRSRSWVRRILRRFRNRGTRPELGSVIRHRAVNLLPEHSAFTNMRALSRPWGYSTEYPLTAADFSSYYPPITLSEVGRDPFWTLRWPLRVSNYYARGSSGNETADRGESGRTRLGRADFTNR